MGSVKLSELDEFICCPVCHGYLIEATTINECLHSFCRSCIIKHIKNNNNECPKCNTLIHARRPLDYIIHDRNKQDIVYKLVPQLYISELKAIHGVHNPKLLKKKFLHVELSHKNKSPAQDTGINQLQDPIYLKCPLDIKISHIRKLLAFKYQLEADDRISILYKGDIVSDDDQVSNLAQSLTFCLQYEISRVCARPYTA